MRGKELKRRCEAHRGLTDDFREEAAARFLKFSLFRAFPERWRGESRTRRERKNRNPSQTVRNAPKIDFNIWGITLRGKKLKRACEAYRRLTGDFGQTGGGSPPD